MGGSAGTPGARLPRVECALGANEIRARLSAASKRGRLPGFENHKSGGVLFSVSAFGQPFDGILEARTVDGTDAATTLLRFECRVARRMLLMFAAALLVTVWPGVYFMDQLMIQLAPGWREALPATWVWYLPLTVLPIPWLWVSVMRRTRRSVAESARTTIDRIAREVDGRVI
jgi:hypothetical protein